MASKKRIKKIQNKNRVNNNGTNVFAILSLVFGILFFIPLAAVLAIVFGFISLSQIKTSNEDGKGMAIAGIILGFFWVLIWVLLLVFFFMIVTTAIFASIPTAVIN